MKRRPPNAGWRLFLVVLIGCAGTGLVLWGAMWWEERPLSQAEALLDAGQVPEAMALLDEFLKMDSRHGRALMLRARALADSGRWRAAIDLFETVGASDFNSMRAWTQALLHEGRWVSALPRLEVLLRDKPNDADLLHEITACQAKLGKNVEALESAARFAEQPGMRARGHLLIGTLHRDRLNYQQAADAWQVVLQEAPDALDLQVTDHDFFLEYGNVMLSLGKPEQALALLKRSRQLRPAPGTLSSLGDASFQTGDLELAERSWREALAADPANRQARVGLANLSLGKGNTTAAAEIMAPLAARPDEMTASGAYLMQRIFTLLKDVSRAASWQKKTEKLRKQSRVLAAIDQILRDAPESRWANIVRAYRFAERGEWGQAELLLSQVASLAQAWPFVRQLVDAVAEQSTLPPLTDFPLTQY